MNKEKMSITEACYELIKLKRKVIEFSLMNDLNPFNELLDTSVAGLIRLNEKGGFYIEDKYICQVIDIREINEYIDKNIININIKKKSDNGLIKLKKDINKKGWAIEKI